MFLLILISLLPLHFLYCNINDIREENEMNKKKICLDSISCTISLSRLDGPLTDSADEGLWVSVYMPVDFFQSDKIIGTHLDSFSSTSRQGENNHYKWLVYFRIFNIICKNENQTRLLVRTWWMKIFDCVIYLPKFTSTSKRIVIFLT